jgi:transposase
MEFSFFIGIDVSKNELDFAVMQGKVLLFHKETQNTPSGIKSFIKEVFKLPGFHISKTIFCLEHTGIYSNYLLSILHEKKINICLESAMQIKSSMGKLRGKNDKIDAIRIAEYAYTNREKLRLWEPKRDVIQQLADLSAIRSRLVEMHKIIKNPLQEEGPFIKKSQKTWHNALCSRTLNGLKADLKKIEKAIDQIIAADPELKRLFALVTSVSGIGKVIGTMVLITTNEFKDFKDPKKYAFHAGVVPFVTESGVFKGRGQVSHMANKKLKMLFHMSALISIKYNEELRAYYDRKVIGENKNKMSTINAIRNKLILRVFACVNQNRMYEKNYSRLVA